MWPRIIRSSIRSCPSCAPRWPDLAPTAPRIPMISTGRGHDGTARFDADYWAANLRNPVRFSRAVAAAGQRPHHLHRDQPAPAAHPRHHRNPRRTPITTRWALCSATPTTPSPSTPTSTPPTPPTHRTPTTPRSHTHRCPPPPGTTPATGSPPPHRPPRPGTHPLLGIGVTDPTNGTRVWESTLGPGLLWLGDHCVDDACVLPGAAYAELALAAVDRGIRRRR